jgi:MFS family permease
MRRFATPTSVGVTQTFVVLGALYFVAMMAGAFGYRLPPPGWSPVARATPKRASDSGERRREGTAPLEREGFSRASSVPVATAWKTRQFWLLWAVLCLNVSAGIGVLGVASPMIQEIFKGRVTASAAAGFAGLLSLFNIGGRIFWASLSDRLGRKMTYAIFFGLGMLLYAIAPTAGASSLALFVAIFCVILTMYGGGFATIPAYLADLFGAGQVSAIHGRLLTAWSTAGVLGPVLVNYIREFQIDRGVRPSDAYTFTMYVLVGLLAVGFVCNLLVRPVPDKLFVAIAAPSRGPSSAMPTTVTIEHSSQWGLVAVAWTLVGVPLVWGVLKTLTLARQLFGN